MSYRLPIRRIVPFSRSHLLILWSEPITSPDIGHRSEINQPASMIAIHHNIDLLQVSMQYLLLIHKEESTTDILYYLHFPILSQPCLAKIVGIVLKIDLAI